MLTIKGTLHSIKQRQALKETYYSLDTSLIPRFAFFSEMELENALVAGTEEKGEIAIEQAFLKFNLNPKQYIIAGLILPRIGLLNENHLPVNFNGTERPIVEQIVIPATWREVGIGFYGSLNNAPVNYSITYLVNGLNSAEFELGDGIRSGRAEGNALANNLAVTASLQYNWQSFRFQVSGYSGGTVGITRRGADSLHLNSGAFGTPVYLGEANVQYNNNGLSIRLLGSYISIPDAGKINTAYAKNMASAIYGVYAELGYDWLKIFKPKNQSQFITFARYELIDLNASLPAPPLAIYDGTLKQSHFIAGFSYLPIPNVVIKADVRLQQTGAQNPALIINPAPNALLYQRNNTLLNIGVGYSF